MKAEILAIVLLSGCANLAGVEITDEERAACEAQGCTVWTLSELQRLVQLAIKKGYEAGKKSL